MEETLTPSHIHLTLRRPHGTIRPCGRLCVRTPRDGCYVPVTDVSTGPERIEHEEVATMATMTSSQFWDHMKEKAAMHRLPWVSTGASVLL